MNTDVIHNGDSVRISFIVPVYNGEKYVKNCLDMLLNQEGDGFEVIVVNDGSKDKTGEIVKNYKDDRIIYFEQEDKGVSAARNKGIEISRGDWLVFCDVDDEILPGYVKSIQEETQKNPQADIFCYARYYVQDDYFVREESKENLLLGAIDCCGKGIFYKSEDFYITSPWAKVFGAFFIKKHRLRFDEKLSIAEDTLFLVQTIAASESVFLIHKGYYRYVQNSDSVFHTAGKLAEKDGFIHLYNEMIHCIEISNLLNKNRIMYYFNRWIVKHHGIVTIRRLCAGTKGMRLRDWKKFIREIAKYMKESYRQLRGKDKTIKDSLKLFVLYNFPGLYILLRDRKTD